MKHLCLFALGYFCIFYMSCSSDLTEIYNIRCALLYDVQKAENEGNVRLAVYARLNQDAEGNGLLQIKAPKADYIWTVEKPLHIHDTENGYTWIGSSNILPPPGGSFPAGRYVLIYTDEAGKKTEVYFEVDGKPAFDSTDTGSAKESLGIFDKNGVLLGYRTEKRDITAKEAAEQYPGASFMRIIRLSADGSRLLLKEPEFVSDESGLNNGGVR